MGGVGEVWNRCVGGAEEVLRRVGAARRWIDTINFTRQPGAAAMKMTTEVRVEESHLTLNFKLHN